MYACEILFVLNFKEGGGIVQIRSISKVNKILAKIMPIRYEDKIAVNENLYHMV